MTPAGEALLAATRAACCSETHWKRARRELNKEDYLRALCGPCRAFQRFGCRRCAPFHAAHAERRLPARRYVRSLCVDCRPAVAVSILLTSLAAARGDVDETAHDPAKVTDGVQQTRTRARASWRARGRRGLTPRFHTCPRAYVEDARRGYEEGLEERARSAPSLAAAS
jgi:hypothetical protein